MNSKLLYWAFSRVGIAFALGMLGSFFVEAAERVTQANQLRAPTHRQIRILEPTVDGKRLKLHTIATTADGHVLAAVGGQSMSYVMSSNGYETKFVEEPSYVLMLDSEGTTLQTWELELTPNAITVAGDGAIYVGGSGRIAKLGPGGLVTAMIDSPHVGNVSEVREKAAESIRKSQQKMSESFADQIELLQERIGKIEEKDEDERTRLEDAQLKAFRTQMEMLEKIAGRQGNEVVVGEVDESQLDAAVMQSMSVVSMAASDQDIFVCAMDAGAGGYSIWRLGRDLDTDSAEVIMEGLRGCCGQMDIQCCGDDLLISENTRFRVGIYDRHGRVRGSFGKRDRTSRAGFGSCCNPMNSLGLKDGTVLTAESSIGHIKRFDTEGNLVAYIGKASIGAGCKHCALGYDAKRDLYYMMYEDKNAICVLGNIETAPLSVAESQLNQRKEKFLANAAGQWSLASDESQSEHPSTAFFGGGRGGATRHAVSSLKIGSDGSAKILEGAYKVYGDRSEFELLEAEDNGDDATFNFALVIDQVQFLKGTWVYRGKDTAVLSFQGHSPITLIRTAETRTSDSQVANTCAGLQCKTDGCQDQNCPNAGNREADTRTNLAAKVEGQVVDVFEFADEPIKSFEELATQIPVTKFEYKIMSRKQLGDEAESKLNELGAEGWELCGKLGKKMIFKRMSGFDSSEGAE